MDRRCLLKLGVTVLASSTGGCASLAPAQMTADWTDADVGSLLAELDGSMARIGDGDLSSLFALGDDGGTPRDEPRPADVLLLKKSLRSLVLTGAYRELDDKAKEHPGVKRRVEAAQPELDEAVLGMAALLGDLNAGDRVELQRRLDRDPGLAKRIAERLDDYMSSLNMPPERRLRLRRLAQHVTWRLEHQPVSLLLDEYVDKVDKVARRIGYDEQLKREVAARAATSALLTWRDPAQAAAAAETPLDDEQKVAWKRRSAEKACSDSSSPGSTAFTAGGIILGVSGALAIGGGAALAAGSFGGAFVLTGAGVLLLAGLIAIIVGAVQASSSDDCGAQR